MIYFLKKIEDFIKKYQKEFANKNYIFSPVLGAKIVTFLSFLCTTIVIWC